MIKRFNWPLILAVFCLCGIGLLSLWTLSSPVNMSNQSITRAFLVKQVIFLVISLVMLGVMMVPHYTVTRRVAYIFYGLCLITLMGLLVFGRYTRGARGWIPLGPVNLQPAEFMKIAAVLALARWISFARNLHTLKGMIIPCLLLAIPAAIIFVQPDLGNAMLFFPVLVAMLWTGGASHKWIIAMLLVVAIAVPVTYKFGMKEYQKARLTSFIWPERSRAASYQQIQSIKAVAIGGFKGRGLGEAGYNFPYYVPDRHTDFVFSMVGEDMGFVGSSFVVLLFGFFFIQAGRIAHRTKDPYGRLVVVGLSSFLALQVFVNVGMNIGVAPITGLTLPFVSYGGSSLLTCFISLAIIMNVDARWVPTFSGRDMDRSHAHLTEFCNVGMEKIRTGLISGALK